MSASADSNGSSVMQSHIRHAAKGISFTFEPLFGMVADFQVEDQGRRISMMHKAPWVEADIDLPTGAPPHQVRLQGDFFCAPFSDASADGAPLHGWPANSLWQVTEDHATNTLKAMLDRKVMGASVTKELTLVDGHPFLYQSHIFTGGQGNISAANHAMLSLPKGGRLRFSHKSRFQTPETAPEPDPARGRSSLRYPAHCADPRSFPADGGGVIDVTRYPFGPAHEDFVVAIEAEESPLGWTAVTRPDEGDLYLSLRHPRKLPMTMLWHSNGGRDYAPWNSSHLGCLGIEDGIAWPLLKGEVPGKTQAAALTLAPSGQVEMRHITGCLSWPAGEPVRDVVLSDDTLTVIGENGANRAVPILGTFLGL